MIIDAHAHIFPDKIASRAADGISSFYDIPVRFDGSSAASRDKPQSRRRQGDSAVGGDCTRAGPQHQQFHLGAGTPPPGAAHRIRSAAPGFPRHRRRNRANNLPRAARNKAATPTSSGSTSTTRRRSRSTKPPRAGFRYSSTAGTRGTTIPRRSGCTTS